MTTELDHRIVALNSFLQTPHGNVEAYFKIHKDLLAKDPEFYGHLAVWHWNNGTVRDHNEVFATMLISSDHPGHRDAGLSFMRQLPFYQVARVVEHYRRFVAGAKVVKTEKEIEVFDKKTKKNKKVKAVHEKLVGGNLPRSMISELKFYWWEREERRRDLDNTMLLARSQSKTLVERYRIPHSEYVDKVLFEDNPPPGSVFFNLKKIAKEDNPTEQAKMVIENRIPLKTALGLIKNRTPAAWAAIIEVMSPQELINNMGQLKKKGVLDNPDLKQMVDTKLTTKAKTNKRVSALKVKDAIKAAKLSEEDAKILEDVADTQIKAKGRISLPTALLVDKSHSLEQAIEVAKQLGSVVGTVMGDGVPLHVIAFDSMPQQIKVAGNSFSDWEAAFRNVYANGSTAIGAGVALLTRNKIRVEQIVIITDEKENAHPFFVKAYQEYVKAMNEEPHVVIVKVGDAKDYIEQKCKEANIPVDVYEVGSSSDKYSFTSLIPLLARRSKLDLLMDVMAEELPKRKAPLPMPQVVRDRQNALV